MKVCDNLSVRTTARQKSASDREDEMINLKNLEERLNGDIKLREEFFLDPISVLRREGFMLSFEQESRLRQSVAKARFTVAGKPFIFDFSSKSANQQ